MKYANVELRTRPVGEYAENAYVLICTASRDSVLIDPGAKPDTLAEMLQGTRPVAILLTHTHFDHIGALAEMRAQLKVPLMLHSGPHANGIIVDADRWLKDGDTLKLGEHRLRFWYTPGHTQDQICIGIEGDPRIIVGDTIFDGGPGKTWTTEGFATTLNTLRQVVLRWPDDTVCFPGHGPSFRLGDRRKDIEAFLDKDHGAFFGDATWRMS